MQVMHDDDNNITICTALYQSSGFFIIMSPAEGLHFSALVMSLSISPYESHYFANEYHYHTILYHMDHSAHA